MFDNDLKWLLRSSWDLLRPHSGAASSAFYERLFELEPSIRKLFRGDLEAQRIKLVHMLEWIMAHMEDDVILIAGLQQMGKRHAAYGVTADHYAPVGSALTHMFQHTLGADFTPDMEDAWISAYAFLSSEMEHGARL